METVAIMEKLDSIQSELDFIKEYMVDADTILTEEDKTDLALARKEFEQGKTISFEELKKELKV